MKTAGLCAILLAAVLPASAETWWRVFGGIEPGAYRGGHSDDENVSAEEKELLGRAEFDEWVTHEDELVSLTYPKHPLIQLEVNGGENGVEVEGGVCTTVDNSFQRAYILRVGETTYGVFLLNPASWLDDGICLCGPMVHHVYRVEEGCLVRFSLLPGGAVKKAQVLGDKLRLMAFEWTHLGCPRPVYERMVEGMKLKVPRREGEERLFDKVAKRYGWSGRVGWLHPGIELAEASRLLESEPRIEKGEFIWRGISNDYPVVVKARIDDGRLTRLTTEGVERTGEDAVRGSLTWIEDAIEACREAARADEDGPARKAPPSKEEIADAIAALGRSIPIADWWRLVSAMQDLADELEHPDPRFTGLVVERGTGTAGELDLLVSARHPETDAWVRQRLDRMVLDSPSISEGDDAGWRGRSAAALMKHEAEKDGEALARRVEAFWRTGDPVWSEAVIVVLDACDAATAQRFMVLGFERAIELRSGSLIEALMEEVEELQLPDPQPVLDAIGKLPEGDPDSLWETRKKKASKALEEMRKGG